MLYNHVAKKYSNITLASLSDNKQKNLNLAIQDFTKKSNGSILRCLSDCNSNEVALFWIIDFQLTAIVYRVISYVIRRHTPENRYIPMLCGMLNNAKEIADMEVIDSVIQRCFLDAANFEEPLENLEKNFNELVSQLNNYGLVGHLPTYEAEAGVAKAVETKAVETKPVEEPKVEKKDTIKEEDKKVFIEALNSNTMGDELADLVKGLGLPQHPEFMYLLLDFVIGSHDVTELIRVKNEIPQFIPFRVNNYGSLVYSFYDECDLSVHIGLLNQIVKFWDDKQLPVVRNGVEI